MYRRSRDHEAHSRPQHRHLLVPVRDSKVPDGEVLVFGAASWAAFVTHTGCG
ncbi:DUF397 domain-containing protein [Streptomyces sp. ID05-39B]|uniref:DUF397 domain-containing protein n=1 Tax=Streptomyces sp. ID05-39B TaxID=3028664 RepID=UPI0029B97391|nr:DUF397 domain-containing protein [Streptomyces sp. ID05-39B]MDX3529702.1 DUF397 domain-containing protein [Streptomyces sp. ID05-39B]